MHLVNTDGSADTVIAQNTSLNGLGWSAVAPVYAYATVPNGSTFVASMTNGSQMVSQEVQATDARWVGNSLYFLGISSNGWGLYFHVTKTRNNIPAPNAIRMIGRKN